MKISLKASAPFALVKTEIKPNDFAKKLNIVYIQRTSTYVYRYEAKHKKKVIRLNRNVFGSIILFHFFTQGQLNLS